MADSVARRRRPDSSELSRSFHAACSHRPGAVHQLLELYRPLLLKLAYRKLHRDVRVKVAPSDLVQTTLWKATQAFEDECFAHLKAFRAWLITILNNEAMTVVRRYALAQKRDVSREVSLFNPETYAWIQRLPASLSQSGNGGMFVQEQIEDLLRALAMLPPHYQLVLRWRYFEKLKFEAIGKKLDRSADAARVLHNRALMKLKVTLQAAEKQTNEPASST